MEELTKVINKKCQDCGKQINILCNERCQILAVRCPDCFQIFLINVIEIEYIIEYLTEKGWKEKGNRITAPHPQVYMFIPSQKDISDYIIVVKKHFKYSCSIL